MDNRIFVIHALTPLHPGTGQGTGLIDLPVAREITTRHPFIPGSSVKGVLRAGARTMGDPSREQGVFGPDRQNADKHAGALCVSDARVLLFPVHSDRGAFAWVTSPYALGRFFRDMEQELPTVNPRGTECAVPRDNVIEAADSSARVVLAGLSLTPTPLPPAVVKALAPLVFPGAHDQAWRTFLQERLCVVNDDTFAWLVENATDVRAHIAIDEEKGTVTDGALWYEETLPAETVLAGTMQWAPNGRASADDAWGLLRDVLLGDIQLGGGATTGLGRARMHLHTPGGVE